MNAARNQQRAIPNLCERREGTTRCGLRALDRSMSEGACVTQAMRAKAKDARCGRRCLGSGRRPRRARLLRVRWRTRSSTWPARAASLEDHVGSVQSLPTQPDDLAQMSGLPRLRQEKMSHCRAGDGATAGGRCAFGVAVARRAVVGEKTVRAIVQSRLEERIRSSIRRASFTTLGVSRRKTPSSSLSLGKSNAEEVTRSLLTSLPCMASTIEAAESE